MANRTADLPVLAGLDALVMVDGRTVGWATNMSWDEDFELQGIRTLGFHGDRGWKSMGYNCSCSIGTFVLYADSQSSDALPVETRTSILKSGYFQFELYDKVSAKHMYSLVDCKCGTQGCTFDSGGLATRTTTWRVRIVQPDKDNVAAVEAATVTTTV